MRSCFGETGIRHFNFSSPISFLAYPTNSPSFIFFCSFIFLSNSRYEGKDDEETGRKEESATISYKAKAYEENEKRSCTDTFIPVSITALAGVDSFLMLTCATCIYTSRSGRLLPAKRGHGREISRKVPSRVSRRDINYREADTLSWNLYIYQFEITKFKWTLPPQYNKFII